MSRTTSARMKTVTMIPKPKRTEDEAFMKLYCACLSGVASQLEQTFNNKDGRYCGDVFADDQKSLLNRECFAVKRAFRMASLALEELQIDQFNAKL
jgi:hypothetical protein